MARAGARYPQVEPTAAALIDRRAVDCPAAASVSAALDRARAAGAEVVVLGARRALGRGDLERLVQWGLGTRRASLASWQDLPAIDAGASEIAARRLVMGGAPLVLVTRGPHVVGAVDGRGDGAAVMPPALSLAHRLDHALPGASEALPWLLRVAGKVGEGLGLSVFATGGFVRDLLLGRAAPDLDLVVEGDGVRYARQLADEVGGRVASHPAFGTASLEGAAGPGGVVLGRIDVASARAERYERPGALPVVRPASIGLDLRRRDFAINAMAVALHPSAFGRLLDPHGGQRDLARRRLRPLSPLSFVEDPTRLFRAARYAARLGFGLDPASAPARLLALSTRFGALSGERLRAEIELLAAEPRRRRAFELLASWGVLAIVDRALEPSPRARRLVADADRLLAWALRRGVEIDATETFLTALLAGRTPSVTGRILERLSIRGEPARRLAEASRVTGAVRQLSAPRLAPSEISRVLDRRAVQAAAGIWLGGGSRARRRVVWFLDRGRGIRPRLSGADVVALGVRRGPDVGECLAALRRERLDGRLGTVRAEERFVEQWQRGRETGGGEVLGCRGRNRARKGGVR